MPTPNATLLASVNGGSPTTGGITAATGNTVQFTFQNTTGWRSNCRLELSFPAGFSLPSGWSSETVDGHTVYYVLGNTTPPPITLGPWGKYMTRLIVNGGVATDEATAISVPSPGGLLDLGHREAGQFGGSAEKWAKDQRANLRVIEAGLGGGGGSAEDVDPTADTLLLRGSAGEGRVTRVELADARLLPGEPTQAGDLGFLTNGRPAAWNPGTAAAEAMLLRSDVKYYARVHRPAETTGLLTNYSEVLSLSAQVPMIVTRVSWFQYDLWDAEDVGGDPGDSATILIESILLGVSSTTIASLEFSSTSENTFNSLDISSSSIGQGEFLRLLILKNGAGVLTPKLTVFVEWTIDPTYVAP